MIRLLRIAGGVLAGYALMVVLITLVQESWLGGVSWSSSSLPVLTLAGLLTFLSAAVGGFAAAWISGSGGRVCALVMSGLVVVETTALALTGRSSGPLWFDLLALTSLIVGILLGAELLRGIQTRQSASTAS